MVRTRHSTKLDSRKARRQLEVGKRHMETISPGRYLVYRKPKSGGVGSWQACFVNTETRKQTRVAIGVADDFKKPDGIAVLDFQQAQAAARTWFKEQARLANIESEAEQTPDTSFTVADAMEAYFKDAMRRGVKGITQDRCRSKAWILPAFANVQVSKLTRESIENWLDEMAHSPKKTCKDIGREQKQNPPPQTDDQRRARKESANRVLAILKAALTYCIDRKLTDSHDRPWQLVKRYKGTSKARIRFLSIEEQVRLVNACPADFGQLVRGALLTGCRYGELTRFKCKDYDAVNSSVFVAESKSGKPRHVYITEEGRELFNELIAGSEPEDYMFTNGAAGRRNVGPGPSRWRSKEQNPKMHRACSKAGIEPVTFHELRHTYASMLVNRGCVLSVVADLLGHSSIKMVEKHYGHLSRSTVRDELLRAMPRLGILRPVKEEKKAPDDVNGHSLTKPEPGTHGWKLTDYPIYKTSQVIMCAY